MFNPLGPKSGQHIFSPDNQKEKKRKMILVLTLEGSLIITDSPSTDTTLPLYNRSKIENWQGKQQVYKLIY